MSLKCICAMSTFMKIKYFVAKRIGNFISKECETCFNHFTQSKVLKPLRCNRILRLKEKKRKIKDQVSNRHDGD